MKKPLNILVFGWAMFLFNTYGAITFFINHLYLNEVIKYLTIGYFLLMYISAIGILNLKNWARITLFVLLFFKIANVFIQSFPYLLKSYTRAMGIVDIIGITILAVFVVWFLNKKSIVQQFVSRNR